MSKYNDFMSHIRVDDEMHRRIMDAVSDAIKENAESGNESDLTKHFETAYYKAEVQHLNSKDSRNEDGETSARKPARRSTISLIKGFSIAAAAVLVVGGAIMFASRFGGTKSATLPNRREAAYETAADAEQVDGGIQGYLKGKGTYTNKDNTTGEGIAAANGSKKTINGNFGIKGTTAAAVAGSVDSALPGAEKKEESEDDARKVSPSEEAVTSGASGDIKDSLTFRVKTVGTGSLKNNKISMKVYTGTNGEKMILFTATEGTDIVKAYYPDFKGTPALLQTEGGQVFKAIDTSVGRNATVGNTGPYDAVTWTKNGTEYMVAFGSKTDVQVFISIMDKI